MIKTHYRDYATEAYRLYARLGGAEAYKRRIYAEAQERHAQGCKGGPGSPTEAAVLRGEAALAEKEGTWRDLEAVERAVQRIEGMRGGTAILCAVRRVYQEDPEGELGRGEIQRRVDRLSVELPAGRSSIFRWLAIARRIFAEERGLRTE